MRTFVVPLIAVALLAAWCGSSPAEKDPPAAPPRFPAVSNDDAWKQLPRENPPLPAWARVLVQPLPRTTGAMLELDHVHRANNPLGPVLAGKLQWAAADAIGCAYSKQYAEADLRKAGLREDDLKKLTGRPRDLPDGDRLAITFARKMTRAAHTVTDEEVAELIRHFGSEKVVTMVHTLAYANFKDRICLALAVEVEPGGPLPSLDLKLDPEKRGKLPTPPRPAVEEPEEPTPSPVAVERPDWGKLDFLELGKSLDKQKARKSRIPLPDLERGPTLPPEEKARASRIVWTQVSMGYQPRLTKAWFDCMRTFQQEAKLDPVFSNSVFWVITRSNECFY